MIRLGLRLTVSGGREVAARLVIIAAAVALGVGLLLTALAGINAVNAQNDRYAWLDTGAGAAAPGHRAPLWWLLRADFYGGQAIGRVDVAAAGPGSPVPPGLPHLPGPGQYYASPALSRLLRATPAAQLADRYPGRQAGIIGRAALPAPNSLIIVIGHTPAQLAPVPGARRVTSIYASPPSSCNGPQCVIGLGIDSSGIDLILSSVAAALLFPVLIFIVAATRLSAARREERFAAMRLAGAEPRQISVISAVESLTAALAGVAAGFGVFFLLRPAVAAIPFTGAPFFTGDMSLNLPDILLVAAGVPLAAAAAARLALHRVHISPLGVSRRAAPAPPRAWRVIPLLAGVAELGYFAVTGVHLTTSAQIVRAFLPGFLLIIAGLVIAGPWLTMAGARTLARHASRPATLIAARRLADNPSAGFRAISGLVIALFVTTAALGMITTFDANRGTPRGAVSRDILADQISAGQLPAGSLSPGQPVPASAAVPAVLLARLRSVRGVRGVLAVHVNPLGIQVHYGSGWGSQLAGLASCAQLARVPALGRCPAGARAAAIPPQAFAQGPPTSDQGATVWPAAAISAGRLQRLPVQVVAVGTDGSRPALERARTLLEAAYPGLIPPATLQERFSRSNGAEWQQLADVIIIVSLAIAGCTLAVSVAAGLSERKRPFSLLRLTGAPLGMLRRVVGLESAVPLLLAAAVSTGAGFLAAQLYLTTQLHYSLAPPGPAYYLVTGAGLAASLAIIAATLPLLSRITGPETARNE